MITANEARRRIETLDTSCGRQERQLIEEKIRSAIERECFSLRLDFLISDEALAWLKSLEYEVIRDEGSVFCMRSPNTEVYW